MDPDNWVCYYLPHNLRHSYAFAYREPPQLISTTRHATLTRNSAKTLSGSIWTCVVTGLAVLSREMDVGILVMVRILLLINQVSGF